VDFDIGVLGQQLAQLTLAILVLIRFGIDLRLAARHPAPSEEDETDGRGGTGIHFLRVVEAFTELAAAVLVVLALAVGLII
jgi:hypothetical protein